jgi:hypothetical protein
VSKTRISGENIKIILKKGLVLDIILTSLGFLAFFLAPISIVIVQGSGYGEYLAILLLPISYLFVFGFLSLAGLLSSAWALIETFMLFRILDKSKIIKPLKKIDIEDRRLKLRGMIRIGSIVLIVSSLIAIPLMLGFYGGIQ